MIVLCSRKWHALWVRLKRNTRLYWKKYKIGFKRNTRLNLKEIQAGERSPGGENDTHYGHCSQECGHPTASGWAATQKSIFKTIAFLEFGRAGTFWDLTSNAMAHVMVEGMQEPLLQNPEATSPGALCLWLEIPSPASFLWETLAIHYTGPGFLRQAFAKILSL